MKVNIIVKIEPVDCMGCRIEKGLAIRTPTEVFCEGTIDLYFRLFFLFVEKQNSVYREQWWDQVWASAKKTKKHPILVYKFDRQDIQAVLPLYLIGGGWSARKEYRADVSFANMYAIMRNYISGSHFERFPFQEAVAPNEDAYQGMFFNHKIDKDLRDEGDGKNQLVFTPTSTL